MQRWGRSAALGLGLGWAVVVLISLTSNGGLPVDAWCYYGMDPADPWRSDGCFVYSPPIALVMGVVQDHVSFVAFATAIRVAEMVVLAILAGPAIGPALLIPAVAIELNAANINLLLVGAVLLSLRFPWMWAFVILTKVTPGVGLLWFAARKEWRNLAIALAATAVIAAASWILAPWMWSAYIAGMAVEPDASPFAIAWRLPLAALIVIWGARTDRKWALVLAVFLAMPRWYYLSPVILVGWFAVVRLPRPVRLPQTVRLPGRFALPRVAAPTTAVARATRARVPATVTAEGSSRPHPRRWSSSRPR